MSEVQRYSIKDGWFVADESGKAVSYEAYAALHQKLDAANDEAAHERNRRCKFETDCKLVQQKLEAVLAENVVLKKQSVRIFNAGYSRGHESTVEGNYVHVYRADEDSFHEDDVSEIINENTPATDAILNKVRADGIDSFASFLADPIDGESPFQHVCGLANHFANTLRAAKDGDHV